MIGPTPGASADATAKAVLPSETAAEIMLRRAQRIGRLAFWQLVGPVDDAGLQMACAYSDGIEPIFGCNPTFPMPDFVERFVHPEDQDRTRSIFMRFRRRQLLQYAIEYRIRHLSGEWRLIHETGEWELSPDGKPITAAGVIQDTTDRSQLEARLRQSETLLASAQRMARIGTWHWMASTRNPYSFEGRYYHSQEVADIFGVTIPELDIPPQQFLDRFVHPDDRQRLMDMWRIFRSPGRPNLEITYRARRADGAWRILREFATWERAPDGELTGVAGLVEDITDRTETQKVERQRSAMLARAQRMAKLGTWVWRCGPNGDGPSEAIEFSPEAAEIHGVAAAELSIGGREYAARFVHPDDRAEFISTLARFMQREIETYSLRFRIHHASGEWRTILEVAEWDFSPDGLPTGTIGVMQDITEQLDNQRALDRSEALLTRAQQVAKLGYWHWAFDFSLQESRSRPYVYSPLISDIFGVPLEELLVTDEEFVDRFPHPTDRERVREVYRAFNAEKVRSYTVEYRICHGITGEWRTVSDTGEWNVGPDGRLTGASGAIQDITERVETSLALQRSEQLLARAQQITKLAYWHWAFDFSLPDPRDTPYVYSPSIAEIFGVSLDDLKGSDDELIDRFIHPADRERVRAVYRAFTGERMQSYAIEYRARHGITGEWRTVFDTGEWDRDADGQVTGASGALQDITDRSNAETALRQSEKLLTRAQQVAKLGHWRWRPAPGSTDWHDGDISYSDTAAAIYGVRPEDLVVPDRQFVVRFVHPDDRERIQAVYDRFFIDGERRYEAEYRIRHNDGSWRWIQEIAEWDTDDEHRQHGATGVILDITARVESDLALRHSEALLVRAQRTARVGHWVWRHGTADRAPGQGAAHFSAVAAEIFGVDPEELRVPTDEWVRRFVHPEDVARLQSIFNRSITGELTRYEIDYRAQHSDGTWRWVHEIAQWDYDEAGHAIGATGVLQDVTERVEAQSALRRNEAQLKRAQQIAKLSYWHWTKDRHNEWQEAISHYSSEAAQIFGIPVEELARLTNLDYLQRFVHPDERETLQSVFKDFVEMRLPSYSIEYRIRHANGDWRTVSERGEWDRTSDGRIAGATGTIQDITELREAERALMEGAARLKLMTDHLPISIGYMDMDERLQFINATAERWYGKPAEKLVGLTMREFMDAETYRIMEPYVREAKAGKAVKMQMRRQYPAGPLRDIEMLYVPHAGADGKVAGFFGMAFDMTERLAMEAQLRHAQKMEAVGQLTGGVAHDFNNLLGVIVGNLDLLAAQLPADTKAQSLLSTALDAAESGAALIRRLLAFSRRQMLLPKATNLSELVGGMMVLVQRSLGEAVSIETRIPPGVWPALIDGGQLEAAILNLAINARDAMPAGGRLTIDLDNATIEEEADAADGEALPGDYVRVTVRDTGTGIPPDVLPRVLEPFFTTKEVGKGTGLGLSMVYGFVKQSGGFMQIDSRLGEGTAINLYLPRAEGSQIDTDIAAPAHRSLRGDGEVVLVVEDRADMRAYSTEALRALNYEPIDAPDGRTALALLDQNPGIVVLFSDVVLPGGMSGYELARAARAKRPNLKVLLTSGYSERAAGTRGVETDALLEKPFRTSELGRKLAALLGRELP